MAEEVKNNKSELLNMAELIRMELLEEERQCRKDNFTAIRHLADQELPLFKPGDIFEFSNDFNETANINQLKQNLAARCKEFAVVIPRLWERVTEFVDRQLDKPYLALADVKSQFAKGDTLVILRYMHNSGRILWFEHVGGLSDYVFHKIPEITEMITLLFHHSSEAQWTKRIAVFRSFTYNQQVIGKYKYESLVQQFIQTGMMDEALLSSLLSKGSGLTSEVAISLLKCFFILHGPIKTEHRDAYIVPYFANSFMDSSWMTDGYLRLRLDIMLAGLSLPKYVYQLVTVAVLNRTHSPFSAIKVTRNGATIRQDECATHLFHDYNARQITLQVSTTVELIGHSWKHLLETAEIVLNLLTSVWKACRPEVLVYCAHCLFLRNTNPAYTADPNWFYPANHRSIDVDASKMTTFSGVGLVPCTRCATYDGALKPSVPKPLMFPCK
jgi:hypothetical protein